MRSVTTAVAAEIALPITRPAYFIELGFAVPVRLSTRGAIVWNSLSWAAANCSVGGLGIDGSPAQDGRIVIVDTDGTIAALVLAEGVADRTARVWVFFGDSPADADPVLLFAGVLDGCGIDTEKATVTIGCKQAEVLFAPRQYINAASGFTSPIAAGTKISWNGETYELAPG